MAPRRPKAPTPQLPPSAQAASTIANTPIDLLRLSPEDAFSATLQAQIGTDLAAMARQQVDVAATGSDAAPAVPPLSERARALAEEEARLDEDIAIARREQEIRRKRAVLAQLTSEAATTSVTPPLVLPNHDDAPANHGPPPVPAPPLDVAAPAATSTLTPSAGATMMWRGPSVKHPKYAGESSTALRNFLFDCNANFQLLGEATRSQSDRVAYAVSGLSGPPKTAWVNHITEMSMDPTFDPASVTWPEFVDFLQNHLSDRDARSLAAATELGTISQTDNENVAEFADRFAGVLADLPYATGDMQKVTYFLPRLRRDIREALASVQTLNISYQQLVSLARRTEANLIAAGASTYRGPTSSAGSAPSQLAQPRYAPSTPAAGSSTSPPTPVRAQQTCFTCGKPGHIQRHCPQRPSGTTPSLRPANAAPPRRNVTCFSCGEPGHYSTDCPHLFCRNCNRQGHTTVRCPEPRAPAGKDQAANPNFTPLARDRGANATTS